MADEVHPLSLDSLSQKEYTSIDSSFSSFLLGQEAVQTVNQEVDTDSLSSFSFPLESTLFLVLKSFLYLI